MKEIRFLRVYVTVQVGWSGGTMSRQEALLSARVRGFVANTGRKQGVGAGGPHTPRRRRSI